MFPAAVPTVFPAVRPGTTASVGRHEDRPHLPIQPDHPRWRPGPGTRARQDAALLRPPHPRARSLRRSAARCGRHPARQQPPDGRQRLDGPDRPRRVMRPAHDPGAAGRGVRRHPPARTVGSRSDHDRSLPGRSPHGRHLPRRWRKPRLRLHESWGAVAEPSPGPVLRRVRGCCGHGVGIPRRRVRDPLQRGRGGAQPRGGPMAHGGPDRLLHRAPRATQGPHGAARRHVAPAGQRKALGGRRRP